MQDKLKNDDKPKNNASARPVTGFFAPLLLGLGSILWLGIVGLLQFPIYNLLSQNISDTQTVMIITATIFISLYILGIIGLLSIIFRRHRQQNPKLKNENHGGKSQLQLAIYTFIWLWLVLIFHIAAFALLPQYFPEIDLQSGFFPYLTPVLYISGAMLIMYLHYKR